MPYVFRGLRRESGEPVIGRLIAVNEAAVYKVLEAHGIIAEAVHPEEAGGLFPPSLQEAIDEIGLRITFNQIPKVHEGGGVWILDRRKITGRVMQLAREVCGGAEGWQPALHHIEQMLDTHYGDRRPDTTTAGAGEGRFASAEEVRAEMNRLKAAIQSLERELGSMKSRPYAEPQPFSTKRTPRDRTRDDVLREIFEHNLQLMKLTREHGINGPAGQ